MYKIKTKGKKVFEVQNQLLYIEAAAKDFLLGTLFLVETCGKTFFAHFFVLPKKKKKRQKQVPPYPRKQRRRVNNFWKVTVVTRSPHQDERARSMWELLPPCRRGRPEPLVSQLVSSLLSCKFCTKNCYFSLFCRWWFCCVCVFVFFF